MSPDDRNVSAAVPCADRGQLNSGIVVFSSTRKALYVNEAGQQLQASRLITYWFLPPDEFQNLWPLTPEDDSSARSDPRLEVL
jgi:hypothetical protein